MIYFVNLFLWTEIAFPHHGTWSSRVPLLMCTPGDLRELIAAVREAVAVFDHEKTLLSAEASLMIYIFQEANLFLELS